MGQPIHLIKDGRRVTLYGMSEAAKYLARGWISDNDETVRSIGADDLTKVVGVSTSFAAEFADIGIYTYSRLANATIEELIVIPGIGPKKAEAIIQAAGELV